MILGILLITVATAAILLGLGVVRLAHAEGVLIRKQGLNGILIGITQVAIVTNLFRIAQAGCFIAQGTLLVRWDATGDVSSWMICTVALVNVTILTATTIYWQMTRRRLILAESLRQQGLSVAGAARVVITAKDAHDAAVIVEIKAAQAVVSAEQEVEDATAGEGG